MRRSCKQPGPEPCARKGCHEILAELAARQACQMCQTSAAGWAVPPEHRIGLNRAFSIAGPSEIVAAAGANLAAILQCMSCANRLSSADAQSQLRAKIPAMATRAKGPYGMESEIPASQAWTADKAFPIFQVPSQTQTCTLRGGVLRTPTCWFVGRVGSGKLSGAIS